VTGSSNRIFTIIGASDQTRHARYGAIVSASSAAASGVAPAMHKRRMPRSRRMPEKGPLLSINAATRCFHAAYAPWGAAGAGGCLAFGSPAIGQSFDGSRLPEGKRGIECRRFR